MTLTFLIHSRAKINFVSSNLSFILTADGVQTAAACKCDSLLKLKKTFLSVKPIETLKQYFEL